MTTIEQDRYDRRLALGATGELADLNTVGVIEAADVHVATRLAQLVEEGDDLARVTLALVVRAAREGSTSLDPEHARELLTESREGVEEPPVIPIELPSTQEWLRRVADSALAGAGVLRVEHALVYLDRYHREEVQVAQDLARRAATPAPAVDEAMLEAGLERVFPGASWTEQRDAVRTAVGRLTTVLAGGPGTGKTSTVAGLLTLLLEQAAGAGRRPRIALAAPTGKAAARLRESVLGSLEALSMQDRERLGTDIEAVTVHRLLGWRPDSSNRFRRGRGNPLPHDIVVVDEASMLSLTMTARLLEALRPSARLLLVGDPDQLASVEAGAVLADLVAGYGEGGVLRCDEGGALRCDEGASKGAAKGGDSPVARLRTSHRFGKEIGALAEAVRVGDADGAIAILAASREGGPVQHVEVEHVLDADEALRPRLLDQAKRLRTLALDGAHPAALRELGEHRLLCAHRDGPWGVGPWNDRVERWLAEATGEHGRHQLGRPLLVTANDRGLGLFNGDTGVMSLREGRVVGVFGEPEAPQVHAATSLADVETAYAMTIHKSQGSQATSVTVLLPDADSRLLTRELLYTAITRAQKSVVLVGSEEAIRAAITRRTQRATGLRHRL
ncbi:exodeoxyribonuclease V subunit alpha [Janibacter sp. DB-40]|uniref:exodeoxyribonuclease V subunit alpha n=1 Tax=Janibacter sp. DB-40 TaxID=3028808 RepID=UPI0024071FDC|nr:exodeoxyribonuclease V subunit alpha [Janibacter sp. DB-40]